MSSSPVTEEEVEAIRLRMDARAVVLIAAKHAYHVASGDFDNALAEYTAATRNNNKEMSTK
jgi:hypothetical protein